MRHTAHALLAAAALFMTSCASDTSRAPDATGTRHRESTRHRHRTNRQQPIHLARTQSHRSFAATRGRCPRELRPVDVHDRTIIILAYDSGNAGPKRITVEPNASGDRRHHTDQFVATKSRKGCARHVTRDGEIIETTRLLRPRLSGNLLYLGGTLRFDQGASPPRAARGGRDGALPAYHSADPQPGQKYRQEYYAGKRKTTAKGSA